MKKIRLFVLSALLIVAMLAVSGFVLVGYGGVLLDSFVSVVCILVSLSILAAVLVGNYYAKRLSFTDLLPIIALVAVILLVNLFLARPIRKVPQSTSANNLNVNGGLKK